MKLLSSAHNHKDVSLRNSLRSAFHGGIEASFVRPSVCQVDKQSCSAAEELEKEREDEDEEEEAS